MPQPFGRHLLLLERIALGGMAEVFRAKTFGVEGFERLVAIKRILPSLVTDHDFIKMFIDEARIAAQLTHQNIVQIYDLGKDDPLYYISMEYVAGRDLRLILDFFKRRKKPMDVGMACFLVARICEALDYAHNKRDASGKHLKIIHRDVSPQNVMISYEGEVKLCDFGIAKAVIQSTRTQVGVLKGKFAYMSPEQVRGRPIDRRSDLFALGVIFYEMLTGERLFLGESDYSTLEAVREARVPKPRSYNRRVPAELERIALKLLAKDVDRRYQWASEVFEDLFEFVASSDKRFHARHLRQFMQDTYRKEISVENAKLEAFHDMKLPDADFVAEPTGDLEDPGISSVVVELSALSQVPVEEIDAATSEDPQPDLEDVPELPDMSDEVEVLEVEGRPAEERGETSDPGAGIFDILLHEAKKPDRASSIAGNRDPTDDGSNDTFVQDDLEPQTLANLSSLEDGTVPIPAGGGVDFTAPTNSASGHGPYDARELALRQEISDARSEMLRRMDEDPADMPDDGETIDASEVPPSVAAAFDAHSSGEDEGTDETAQSLGGAFDDAEPTKEASEVALGAPVHHASLDRSDTPPPDSSKPAVVSLASGSSRRRSSAPVAPSVRPPSVRPPSSRPPSSRPPSSGPPSRPATFAVEPPVIEARTLRDPKVLMILAGSVGVLLLALITMVAVFWNRGPELASLSVATSPVNNVEVFLDGQSIAKSTPISHEGLALGTHVIELRAPGYRTYRQEFRLDEPRPHSLSIPLVAAPGAQRAKTPRSDKTWTLELTTQPTDAKVFIDGKEVGRTPMFQKGLAPGKAPKVRLERDGFAPFEKSVPAPKKRRRYTLRVELEPAK